MRHWFIEHLLRTMIPTTYDNFRLLRHTLWMPEVRRFSTLAEQLMALPRPVRLVGIDGLGGAGKTTFAARLAAAATNSWPVIHTDDFASHDNPLDWWPRFQAQVVEPLLAARPATFRPYDWIHRTWSDEVTVPPADVVLLEGVGATRGAWRERLALRVWVETPRELRLRRGLERDGEELANFWASWMQSEDNYVATERPQQHADLIVDGDPDEPHNPEREFVIVSERRAVTPPSGPDPGSPTRR